MAAYAALVSLMNDLDLIPNHPFHSFCFDDKQITSLSQTIHFLIDFMESYDSHGCSRKAARDLESRVASAARATHYLIEYHVICQIHAGITIHRRSRSYFLFDLQKAIDNMIFVKRKAMQFQAKSVLKGEKPKYSPPTPSKPSTSRKNVMVGFEDPVLQLLSILTTQSSTRQTIPIVGMGGMGKTTLAQLVYDHLLIKDHFVVRRWATISQQYSIVATLTHLLFGEVTSATGGSDVHQLGKRLRDMLWARRYLIVLDDMWSSQAWDDIQMFLPDNNNGSCIVVTTRLYNLGTHLSSDPFTMKFLGEDQSWELFRENVFGKEDCPPNLEEIGKRIVRKRCRGLPLSIVLVGGNLRRSPKEVEYWEKVLNYQNPISSSGDDEQGLELLSLSYQHLPPFLKPCFLFMGTFQEDELIDASKLIRFWVAEGFVRAKEGLSLEDVAEGYLEDLIERNLILARRRRWNGKVEVCVIHDIVREMCLMVGKTEQFMRREHCVVILEYNEDHCYGPFFDFIMSLDQLWKFKPLIRRDVYSEDQLSLDLRSPTQSTYFNTDIDGAHFQQVNLRYLDFYFMLTELEYFVPSSVSLFWNLQTLSIKSHVSEISAPYEIWEMSQIRHLELAGFCLPGPLPSERSNQEGCIVLRNLHTVLGVKNFRLTEDVCERMPKIKRLSLAYDNFPVDREASSYYCLENLGRFTKLESLECKFSDDSKWHDVVLSFKFPNSLEEMILDNCNLDWEELTHMIESLSHLRYLELYRVQGHEWNFVDQEFPKLQILKINNCDDLVDWNANSSHFPMLEILNIWATCKLSEIPSGIGEISTLRYLSVMDCSVFAAVSAMRIVVERESLGNEDLRLYVCLRSKEEIEEFQNIVEEEGLKSSNLSLRDAY